MIRGALLFLIVIGTIPTVLSQEDVYPKYFPDEPVVPPCSENYQAAFAFYEVGDFDRALELLDACSMDGLTKREKIEVLDLQVKTHYENRSRKDAEDRARDIYLLNPEFQPPRDENPVIKSLYQNVKPVVSSTLSLMAGPHFGMASTVTNNTFDGNADYTSEASHFSRPGFTFSIQWKGFPDWPVQPVAGLSYAGIAFGRTMESISSAFDYVRYRADENCQVMRGDIGISYQNKRSFMGFYPFAEAGLNYTQLYSNKLEIESTYIEKIPVTISSDVIDISESRNDYSGMFVSIGGLKAAHRGNFLLRIRYDKGLSRMVNQGSILDNQELIFSHSYFDNDFVLNGISVQVGYERYIFRFK